MLSFSCGLIFGPVVNTLKFVFTLFSSYQVVGLRSCS